MARILRCGLMTVPFTITTTFALSDETFTMTGACVGLGIGCGAGSGSGEPFGRIHFRNSLDSPSNLSKSTNASSMPGTCPSSLYCHNFHDGYVAVDHDGSSLVYCASQRSVYSAKSLSCSLPNCSFKR